MDKQKKVKIVEGDESEDFESVLDFNTVYPYRLKEIVILINSQIEDQKITRYDIISINAAYKLKEKRTLCYVTTFGAIQYSYQYVDWVENEYGKNPNLFSEAREKYYKSRYGKSRAHQ